MPEIISIDEEDIEDGAIEGPAEAIRSGDLVIYPTETVYGLAADATSDEAVARVFETKSRPLENPISVAVDSLSMAYRVGKLSPREEQLIQKLLPGSLTVLVNARPETSSLLMAGTEKIGIRIPEHPVALELIKAVDGPITSTSANVSGNPPPKDLDAALEQLGERVEWAIDSGPTSSGKPSTVVDVHDGVEIIRKGPVSEAKIRSILDI